MSRRALAALLVLLAGPAVAAAADGAAALEAAGARLTAGDPTGARAALLELADRAPDDPLAADALFEAGRLSEEALADPAAALALYRRLTTAYPDARTAPAAERRAEALARVVGADPDDAAAATLLQTLRAQAGRQPLDEALREGEALLAARPGWRGAGDLELLLGELALRGGRPTVARRWFEAAAGRGPPLAALAHERTAEAALAAGDGAAARAALAAAHAAGAPAAALDDLGASLATHDVRAGRTRGAAIALGVALLGLLASLRLAAGSGRAALARLWPPPGEVLYLAPLVAALAAIGLTDAEPLAPALLEIGAAGLAATWLSSAALRGPRRRRAVVVAVHVVLVATMVGAATYLALAHGELLDLVADTLEVGPGPE